MQTVAVAALVFDLAHGGVGRLHQFFGPLVLPQVHGNAQAGGQAEAHIADDERFLKCTQDALGAEFGTCGIGGMYEQRKLVTADPRHRIDVTHGRCQTRCHFNQHAVTEGRT